LTDPGASFQIQRTRMKSLLTFAAAASFCLPLAATTIEADICVYGGTSAGVIAAVQAHKMGKRVVVA